MSRKYLICTFPKNVSLNSIIKTIILPTFFDLHQGNFQANFAVTGKTENFIGSLHCFLGNYYIIIIYIIYNEFLF